MTPGTYNLKLYRGDTHNFRVILWADTGQTVPYDLTGATAEAEIREKSAGTHVVILDTVVSLPNIIDIGMTPELYATCPAKGVWDLQITTAEGEVLTPLAGAVTVTPDVTDSALMPSVARR